MSENVALLSQASAAIHSSFPQDPPTPSISEDEAVTRLGRHFPGFLFTEASRKTTAWIWEHGYDMTKQDSDDRRWICRYCIATNSLKPQSYQFAAVYHGMIHIYRDHQVRAPSLAKAKSQLEKADDSRRQASTIRGEKRQRTMTEALGRINATNPTEQRIANTYLKTFDRGHFQMLLTRYIINSHKPFSDVEDPDLRRIFDYLNPGVESHNAHITANTIRARAIAAWTQHKTTITKVLADAPGLIHISYDGWTAPNKIPLYGVACFFRDEFGRPHKLVLGVPEISTRHTGENIAEEVYRVLDTFGISKKVCYATLDNADNMDTSMDELETLLGWEEGEGKERRGRCFGHILNLSAKALLFGNFVKAIEDGATGASIISERDWKNWVKRGPVGKLHRRLYTFPPSHSS